MLQLAWPANNRARRCAPLPDRRTVRRREFARRWLALGVMWMVLPTARYWVLRGLELKAFAADS